MNLFLKFHALVLYYSCQINIKIMITVYIYTSKTYNSRIKYMKRGDLDEAPISVTSHKGGGIFRFNGTREEFIYKVVQDKYLVNPTGYSMQISNGTTLNLIGRSPLHTPLMKEILFLVLNLRMNLSITSKISLVHQKHILVMEKMVLESLLLKMMHTQY